MHDYFSTYRELVQWGWDVGLLRMPEDSGMFGYAAGLGIAMGDMAEDFHALEMIGKDVGVWLPTPEYDPIPLAEQYGDAQAAGLAY